MCDYEIVSWVWICGIVTFLAVELEISEDSEMRVKLAEVQRQYKEKQKELAKLQIKKSE